MPASNADLVITIVDHALLTSLPGIATTLYAIKRDVRDQAVLLGLGMAASGIAAMVGFWAFYADPRVGRAFAFALPVASIVVSIWALRTGASDRRLLKELSWPLLLWILGATFLVFLGFMYGGTNIPLQLANTRFSHPLPSDNDLPQFFAGWFFNHGHREVPPPYPGEWQSSDRPPLQIGYVLIQTSFMWGVRGLDYQIIGVLLQQLWIVGVWAVLLAARVRRGTRALIMVSLLVSDLTIVHGFFVWPKMLAAAFFLAASALVLTPVWAEVRRSYLGAGLLAALIGLSMLSHAATLFGLIPLMFWGAVKGLPRWRWMAVGMLVGVMLVVPWSAYQQYGDPPGNRLIKWMLGGAMNVDSRGVLETIVAGYRTAGWQGTVHNKLENFAQMVGGETVRYWGGAALKALRSGDVVRVIFDARAMFFFALLPQMGLLLLSPFAMALGYRRRGQHPEEWTFAINTLTMFVAGCVSWGFLMFGSEVARPVIHAGSLAVIVLGICGTVSGLRATFPRLAVSIVLIRVLFALVLYVPGFPADLTPYRDYSMSRVIISAGCLLAFAIMALGLRPFRFSHREEDSLTSLRQERTAPSPQSV